MSGPCPECNKDQRFFFGGVLGIEGAGEEGKMKSVGAHSLRMRTLRATLRHATHRTIPVMRTFLLLELPLT